MGERTRIKVAADAQTAARAAATTFVEAVQAALDRQPQATVALSGGTTPRRMHRLLTRSPYRDALAWDRIHLFWVDERLVPYYDAASNFGAACEDLIDPLGLDSHHVHPVPVSGKPAALASDYETSLNRHFGRKGELLPVFDLICLGMGADGHTASLFPGSPSLDEKRRWAIAVKGGSPAVDRITLTLPVINSARQVLFLVTGEDKSETVRRVLKNPDRTLPASRIRPKSENLWWYLDRRAASRIHAKTTPN